MSEPVRQAVYDALDGLPSPIFGALMASLVSMNRVFALTIMDDPIPALAVETAIHPFVHALNGDIPATTTGESAPVSRK